jgi:TolB protein
MKKLLLFLPIVFFLHCRPVLQISYITDRTGNFDIFLTDEQGKNHTQLTTNAGWDWSPQWNPYLNAVIYNSNDTSDNFSLKAMDLSAQPIPLNTYGLEEFILSPKGGPALFTQRDSNFQYIFAFEPVTQQRTVLVQHPSYNGRPRWSPDGRYFSFISDRDGNNEIYLYDLAKHSIDRLTATAAREKYTSWLPNGKAVVFTAQEEGREHNDIFQVDITAKTITRITDDELTYEEIACSPDGKKIAFHGQRDGEHHLFVMDIDGKNERRITAVDAYHGEPEWVSGK